MQSVKPSTHCHICLVLHYYTQAFVFYTEDRSVSVKMTFPFKTHVTKKDRVTICFKSKAELKPKTVLWFK